MSREVRTASDLYDLCQRLFGLGDWDQDLSEVPWWQARQHEAIKIKRSATARKVELADLALAAYYCKAHGHDVRAITWLYKHILPAIRWDNERRRQEAVSDLDELIADAIAHEAEQPDSVWLGRLVRARGKAREEVLAAWQNRDSLPSSRFTSQAPARVQPTA